VRIAVLEALMLRGDALLRTASLRRDPSIAVRLAAVRAIEQQAQRSRSVLPGALDALAAMLEDTARTVRAAALVSLAGLPDDEGLRRFARAFAQTALDVRLALRDEPRAAAVSERLAAGLRTRTDVGLRAATVLALGALGAPGWSALVEPALRDPAPAVRIAALQSLASVEDEKVRARCAELLRDPDLTVREAARRSRLHTVG
jgi:HEAT repeat protein